jgi:hypothetical protein
VTAYLPVLAFVALVVITAGLPLAHWAHMPWRTREH